jgi:signal transduction histidine kinase
VSRIILIPLLLIWAISPIHAQLSIYSNEKEITHEIKGVVYALGSRPSDEKSLQTFFTQFQQGTNWQSSDLKTLSLENLSSAICLKIPIDSILAFNSFHYVEIPNPHINFLQFGIVSEDSVIKTYPLTGDHLPFLTRYNFQHDFVFELDAQKNSGRFIMLVIDKRFSSLEIPIHFFSTSNFIAYNQRINLIFGFIFGLGFLFILIHLLLYVYLKDLVYLWYAIFQVFIFSFIAIEQGYFFQYIYPNFIHWNDVIRPATLISSIVPLYLFFNLILELKVHHPRFSRINRMIVIIYLPIIVGSFVHSIVGSEQVMWFWLLVGSFLSPAMNLFLLGQSVYFSYKKIRYALFLLLSILGNNCLVIIYILAQHQIIERNFLNSNAIYISFIWELLIMSIVLIWRYSLNKKEAELMQLRLLQQQENVYRIIVDNQEKELQRISSLLHDSVGASLGLLRLDIENMDITEKGRKEVAEKIVYISNDIRQLSHSLSPILLQEKGLYVSIDQWVQQFNRSGKLSIHYEWIGPQNQQFEKYDVIAFRIIQELIQNVSKHASASQVFLQVILSDPIFSIYVEDNGVGISSADLVKGVGIKNIEKMMEILGGTCSISSSPGRGFHISVEFNYRINENI